MVLLGTLVFFSRLRAWFVSFERGGNKQLLLMMLTGYPTQLANCGKHHRRTPWTTAWHYFHLLHLRVVSCQRESFITNSALVKAVSLLDSHALAFQADTLNSTASYFSVLFEEILQPLGLLTLRLEHKTHILLRLRSQLSGGGEKLYPTSTVGFPKSDGVAGSKWWIWNFWGSSVFRSHILIHIKPISTC